MWSVHPRPAGRGQPASRRGRRIPRPQIAATVLCCCLVASLLAACGQQSRARSSVVASPSPVAGWHAIAPPWRVSANSNVSAAAQYAVSGDVAGLIVACYGISTSPPDQAMSGTAQLWRSRDGGAHWQALAATLALESCGTLTMISGGNGLLVASGHIEAGSGNGTILVSPDAGDTWTTVANYLPEEIAANRLIAMQQAVYRDGRLYSTLILNGPITRLFSVSDDDGVTWTTLEHVPPHAPDEIPVVTEDFAPDYRTPRAWFRYALHGHLNASLPQYTTLDHSTDDGRTWTAITRLDAGGADLPEYGRPLVTSAQQPSRLCVGLNLVGNPPGPQFPVGDLVLGASDDVGATWHYTRVTHIQADGRAGDAAPLMDARGNCYVSVAPFGEIGTEASSADSTILRLAAGAGAQPQVMATFTRAVAGAVAVFPTSQPNRLALVVLSIPIPAGGEPIYVATASLLVNTIAG